MAVVYKDPSVGNFTHYAMWEEVFAPKYGHAPEPPYTAIKLSVTCHNPTSLRQWIDSIEDRALADRLQAWVARTGRKNIKMLLLPEPVLMSTGVPKELIQVADIRNLIFQIMESFYLVLEALGMYMKNDDMTRLVSDQRWLLVPVPGREPGQLSIGSTVLQLEPQALAAGVSARDAELATEWEDDDEDGDDDVLGGCLS